MRNNTIKEKLRQGHLVFFSWLDLGPPIVEMMGHVGFVSVVLEHEHACRDMGAIAHLLRAADAVQIPAFVRVRDITPSPFQQVLDAVPQV